MAKGDLFNILWDPRVIPSTTYTAADYPKVSAVELDREVLPEDMSNFFVVCNDTCFQILL